LVSAIGESIDALRAEPDPRRAVIAAYARLEAELEAIGRPRRPAEAPLEYMARILGGTEAPSPQHHHPALPRQGGGLPHAAALGSAGHDRRPGPAGDDRSGRRRPAAHPAPYEAPAASPRPVGLRSRPRSPFRAGTGAGRDHQPAARLLQRTRDAGLPSRPAPASASRGGGPAAARAPRDRAGAGAGTGRRRPGRAGRGLPRGRSGRPRPSSAPGG